jgi:adenylate cyclase
MPSEIERKFLVKNDRYKSEAKSFHIYQGFLSTDKERVVRVRAIGNKAYLTIKGISKGIERAEFEYKILLKDARFLLENLCIKPTIDKHRYIIIHQGFTWEVDEFHGDNEGLVVAEIELDHPDQEFPKPAWLGEEVTGDPRYFNANLVSRPFKEWQ